MVGCAPKQEEKTEAPATPATTTETAKWADGKYFAATDTFDEKTGWKETLTIEVKDGKIATVDWNGVSINAGEDKKNASKNGKYPMVEKGGAKAPWHEQAASLEKFLIEKQDVAAIVVKDDGKSDTVAGVSITVSEFAKLAEKALSGQPTQPGPYKDGAYHAELPEFDAKTGWKDMVDLTVMNGNIMAVNWNGLNKAGGDDKKNASKNGKYPMVEKGGAKAPWHEQAASAEKFLIDKQDIGAITVNSDGKTDVVSGVTMTVSEFAKLVTEALASAK